MQESAPTPVHQCWPDAYWLIPHRVLVGAHPSKRTSVDGRPPCPVPDWRERRIAALAALGVSKIVSLVSIEEELEHEIDGYEEEAAAHQIEVERTPLLSGVLTTDEEMTRLMESLRVAVHREGEVIYLHDNWGFNRSAAVAALLWGHLNEKSSADSIHAIRMAVRTRGDHPWRGGRALASGNQCSQIERILL